MSDTAVYRHFNPLRNSTACVMLGHWAVDSPYRWLTCRHPSCPTESPASHVFVYNECSVFASTFFMFICFKFFLIQCVSFSASPPWSAGCQISSLSYLLKCNIFECSILVDYSQTKGVFSMSYCWVCYTTGCTNCKAKTQEIMTTQMIYFFSFPKKINHLRHYTIQLSQITFRDIRGLPAFGPMFASSVGDSDSHCRLTLCEKGHSNTSIITLPIP